MPNNIILHLTGMSSTKYGGLEQYLFELARFCNEKKYHTVIQYESLPQSKEFLKDMENIGVKLIIKPINTFSIKSIISVFKIINSVKPDIVNMHFTDYYVFSATPIVSKILGVKKIFYMKHLDPRLRQKSLQRFLYNQYNQIFAVSGSIVNNLIKGGVNSNIVSVQYLGLFGKRERSYQLRLEFRKEFKIPNEAIVIGCIAWDNPIKGLDVLLKAFMKIINKKSEIHLVIIGVDPKSSKLPELAKKLEVTNNVHWAGIRDNGWQILNVADIYVQPSLSEGLGLAIVEAIALKLPVVATCTGGIPEIVKDGQNGYLAKPGCIDSLINNLERMLANPSQWEIMGNAGYQLYKDRFIGEISVQKLIKKYY